MRDNTRLENNISNVEELIEKISSLGKALKKKMIEIIKDEMAWARLRYDEGKCYHNERIEFANYYLKLEDILKELYRVNEYQVNEIVSLKFDIERARAELLFGVETSINYY